MSISVKQSLSIVLYGDGTSTTFSVNLGQAPFTSNEFIVGNPNSTLVVLSGSPQITGDAPYWIGGTTYPLGTIVRDASSIPFQWKVTISGTAGVSYPFPSPPVASSGITIQDGSVQWISINASSVNTHDNPTITNSGSGQNLQLRFSTAPLLFGSTVTDNFNNTFLIGPYTLTLTFIYNG